jgi:hypothetical protein
MSAEAAASAKPWGMEHGMNEEQTEKKRATGRWLAVVGILLLLLGGAVLLWWHQIGLYLDAIPSRQVAYVGAAALVALGVIMYLWRRASLWRLRRTARRERESLLTGAAKAADDLLAQAAGLAGITLGWAIRAELVRDDLRDVEEYMLHVAKRPRVIRAVVARRDGVVIAATDKKLKSQRLDRVVGGLPPESSDTQSERPDDRTLRLVVPIMGLESRLGTLVFEYERPDLRK